MSKNLYALIGNPVRHSLSADFFNEKFGREKIDASYRIFRIEELDMLPRLLNEHPDLKGFNVTLPYKAGILHYLDKLSEEASEVQAVNTVVVEKKRGKTRLIGYNTDVVGVEKSLDRLAAGKKINLALILGNGGAAQAVKYVLERRQIGYHVVGRRTGEHTQFSYEQLKPELISDHRLIIQTTPVGMYPQTNVHPIFAFEGLSDQHFVFDLIYRPETTLFLRKCKHYGAKVLGGKLMLHEQAEASWRIWQSALNR